MPSLIDGSDGFTDITSVHGHVCATTTAGEVACFGDAARGQLGLDRGGSESCNWVVDSPGETRPCELAPMRVSGTALVAGGHSWVMLSGGLAHTCGITVAGEAYCWGDGSLGQLGSSLQIAGEPALVDGT